LAVVLCEKTVVCQEIKEAVEEKEQVWVVYQEAEQCFWDAQAGLLARELKEGKACPVCGSLCHPKKAKLLETVPEKEEVEQERNRYTKVREKVERLSVEAGHRRERLAEQRQDLEEKAADSDAIEKTLPVVRLVLEQKEWCRENKIYVSATDRQPTEYRYVCNETGEDSGWIIESSKTVSRNGDWKVQVRDAAGNVVEKEITVDNIDTQAPVIRSITEK